MHLIRNVVLREVGQDRAAADALASAELQVPEGVPVPEPHAPYQPDHDA